MPRNQRLKLVAGAAVATVCMTVGMTAPVYAVAVGTEHKAAQPAQAQNGQGHGKAKERPDGKAAKGRSADAESRRGEGHTPVTVCHVLGSGSYHLLTFDDNALRAHEAHGDIYPVPAEGCPDADTAAKGADKAKDVENGRVTVCHVLGNGSYHPLTFDDNALKAHVAHGDIHPMPAEGCPSAEDDATTGVALDVTVGQTGAGATVASPGTTQPEVLGAEQAAQAGSDAQAAILGVEAAAGGPGAPGAAAEVAGILPQTGAGQVGLALVAGTALLGAGGLVLARRRAQG